MICDECETVAHCSKHGCIPKHQALDKMAENARELGLDYEQYKGAIEVSVIFHEGQRMFAVPKQPAQQQEPTKAAELVDALIAKYSDKLYDSVGPHDAAKFEEDCKHLKQALAEQPAQQEPVEWQHRKPIMDSQGNTRGYSDWLPGKGLEWWPHRRLYTSPPEQQQEIINGRTIKVDWKAQALELRELVRLGGIKIAELEAALAAPVQQEPVTWPTMPPSKGQSPVLFEDGYAEGWAKCLSMCKAAHGIKENT